MTTSPTPNARTSLDEIVEMFRSGDDDAFRLELLLDFAKKLPPLDPRFHADRDRGLNRVPECMTPVFMFVEGDAEAVRFHVDVAEEAPTVKGFLSILLRAYDGAPAKEIVEIPPDLVNRLGLAGQIRMNRAIGLGAMIGRIRRAAREKLDAAA